MIVNIALLTVTDTRTIDNDKSGAILVNKIAKANHKLIDRKICKDNKDEIVLILKEWTNNKNIDLMNLAGFCRNCLSRWFREEGEKNGVSMSDLEAREHVYGMPYTEWKEKYQK